jgi:hypothetical protein
VPAPAVPPQGSLVNVFRGFESNTDGLTAGRQLLHLRVNVREPFAGFSGDASSGTDCARTLTRRLYRKCLARVTVATFLLAGDEEVAALLLDAVNELEIAMRLTLTTTTTEGKSA